MSQPFPVYVPKSVGEVLDLLASFMLSSPTFKDDYFTERNVETEFFRLNESLLLIRHKLGEERYAKLLDLSNRMRAHFEADPENKTDETIKGRELILEMEDILNSSRSNQKAH